MYDECRHIKTSGTKCQSPALKGKAYCYFHFRAHRQRRSAPGPEAARGHEFDAPLLEDRAAIQLAISEVVAAMARNRMDPDRGGKILWGLQLAMHQVRFPREIVAPQPVREIFQGEEGEELGTEMEVYETGEDFPDDEEDEEEDMEDEATVADRDAKEQERDARELALASQLLKLSATAGPVLGGRRSGSQGSDAATLQEAIADYIAELKRKHPGAGL
jgi:hypothetical protein